MALVGAGHACGKCHWQIIMTRGGWRQVVLVENAGDLLLVSADSKLK